MKPTYVAYSTNTSSSTIHVDPIKGWTNNLRFRDKLSHRTAESKSAKCLAVSSTIITVPQHSLSSNPPKTKSSKTPFQTLGLFSLPLAES